jgi:hypothetical protein
MKARSTGGSKVRDQETVEVLAVHHGSRLLDVEALALE